MVEGRLDIYGGAAVYNELIEYGLPTELYSELELEISDRTLPYGTEPHLVFGPTQGAVKVTNFLHREGWPFLFEIDRVTLTPTGVELGYNDMRYVQDVGYSSQDPRALPNRATAIRA